MVLFRSILELVYERRFLWQKKIKMPQLGTLCPMPMWNDVRLRRTSKPSKKVSKITCYTLDGSSGKPEGSIILARKGFFQMNNFYVNKIADEHNNHEVHCEDCIFLPIPRNRIKVGRFNTSREAVVVAQRKYIRTDGCWFCCPESHKH